MRCESAIETLTADFTLTCAGYRKSAATGAAGRAGGNLPLMIGHTVLAEIGHDDLLDSWAAAVSLTACELITMTEVAGRRLAGIMAEGIDTGHLSEAVSDAAVLFLLAMRRHGISDPKRIPACTVMWHGQEGRESVLLGA
ncbi:MAG: hypothetical protein ACT4SY_01395 [Hyphomicrobiales bacterium]